MLHNAPLPISTQPSASAVTRCAYSLALLPCLAVCTAAAEEADHEFLRIMSFNLRADFDGGEPADGPNGWLSHTGKHRRDRVIRVIRDAAPHVLGVQEAFANQVDDLTAALPGYTRYGVGRDDGVDRGESCTIYFRSDRFRDVARGTEWLSHEPLHPASKFPGAACTRIASWVALEDRRVGKKLLVVNTHWDHVSAAAREHSASQVRLIVERLRGEDAVIVMGDLNTGEESKPLRVLRGDDSSGLRLADSYRARHPLRKKDEATFNGFKSRREGQRIDFILHGPRLTTRDAGILFSDPAQPAVSDHYPVVAVLDWQR